MYVIVNNEQIYNPPYYSDLDSFQGSRDGIRWPIDSVIYIIFYKSYTSSYKFLLLLITYVDQTLYNTSTILTGRSWTNLKTLIFIFTLDLYL